MARPRYITLKQLERAGARARANCSVAWIRTALQEHAIQAYDAQRALAFAAAYNSPKGKNHGN